MKRLSLAFALLLALSGAGRAQAANVLAPPQWSSDQVRAARPLAPSPALVFEVVHTIQHGKDPARVSHETVTLAESFTLVASETGDALHDRALCRELSWTAPAPTFTSTSCFALPAFRAYEIGNREYLAQGLAKIAPDSALGRMQPYWYESELGLQRRPGDPLTKSRSGETVEYRLDGAVVVRLSGSAATLSADEMQRVVRYLALNTQLHPQPRRELGDDASLPARLEITGRLGETPRLETLAIANVRREMAAYPLPPGLASHLAEDAAKDDTPMRRAVRQAILASQGRSALSRPTQPQLLAAIDGAVKAGRVTEGLLDFFYWSQLYGGRARTQGAGAATLATLRAEIAAIPKDPEASRLWEANNLAGDSKAPGDRQAAARFLATAHLDGLPFGTFRYITFANLVRNSGDTSKWDPAIFSAMPRPLTDGYWRHIAAYPWASNAYSDVGDVYLADYNVFDAWLAYDLGRSVDPDWALGVSNNTSQYEDQLRAALPAFF